MYYYSRTSYLFSKFLENNPASIIFVGCYFTKTGI
jgi:hypothetical protein